MNKYKRVLIATHNDGKVEEFKTYLSPYFEDIISLKTLDDYDEVIEDAHTYEGNAIKKATHFHRKYQMPTISDDSGLEVKVLDGYPGIFSARIGENDEDRNQIVLAKLANQTHRAAQMISVIALVDIETKVFKGTIQGTITSKPIGTQGFGYDSIFYVDALNKTFGQMSRHEKLTISHRGIALKKLMKSLEGENDESN
ncbi:MAG: RdgB/HAM1 family non-canonical purine NTP pyrophosphatase [Acholeplasmataceae bacterium]